MKVPLAPIVPPRLVATAIDSGMKGTNPFPDPDLPTGVVPKYGPDLLFGTGGVAPSKYSVGTVEKDLQAKMRKLPGIFARNDLSGMATRIFNSFLTPQTKVDYFDDMDLSKAASMHSNILFFCDAALNAPNMPHFNAGHGRIHQALKEANWDLSKAGCPSDLGVPAFNNGNKYVQSGDWGNGLALMIDGVQHVYVLATKYAYDKASGEYGIELQYRFYDVFGLDDTDLRSYGASSDGLFTPAAEVGITAWWQLQHQFNYAPLITRIVLTRTYTVAAR